MTRKQLLKEYEILTDQAYNLRNLLDDAFIAAANVRDGLSDNPDIKFDKKDVRDFSSILERCSKKLDKINMREENVFYDALNLKELV